MAEVKSRLKDAKIAIKEKDYEAALSHCKAALKLDKKNYNAMVMFGKASQELEKYEESKKILMLASQVDPDNPTAWLGLEILMDTKPNLVSPDEAIVILTRIADIVKEEEKMNAVYRKIANIQCKKQEEDKAVITLKTLVSKVELPHLKMEAWKSIVELLSNVKELSDDATEQLIEALSNVLNKSILSSNEKNYQLYLKLLYKTGQNDKLLEGARTMADVFPTAYPLEWIARVYVEAVFYSIEGCEMNIIDKEDIESKVEKLLQKHKESRWGNLAKGCLLYNEDQLVDARRHIRMGTESLSTNLLAWVLLLHIQEASRDWSGMETSCRRIYPLLKEGQTITTSGGSLLQRVLRRQAQALIYLGHQTHLQKAVTILSQAPDKDITSQILLIEARLKINDTSTASQEMESLLQEHPSLPQVQLLNAAVVRKNGDLNKAKELYENFIKDNGDNAQGMIELGKLYFETQDYSKALVCCLKAAKLDPKNAESFLYLGHYYRREGNAEKAKKCYEKAYGINPLKDDVGASLSDMYRTLGNHDLNLSLLEKVTKEAGRSSCGWAWLRLGLHHLDMRNFNDAVLMLQCATEVNVDDCVTLECLGDAYFERGSHTAALKVYSKAVEMNPVALYPLCQIAMIKHITGEVLESIQDYNKVLKNNPPEAVRVVALVGLAESLLTSARNNLAQLFHSNVKEDCIAAVEALSKAAADRISSTSIWKLTADACTLLYCLPPSISKCKIPTVLLNPNSDIKEATTIDQLEVLQLGARCYGLALQLSPDDSLLWHDLGVNLYLQRCHVCATKVSREIEEASRDTIERSLRAIKKSLSLNPTNYDTWNTLGIIAAHEDVKDYKLAQHAFITSLEHQVTAVSWTHLGALYLLQDESYLAHEAFSQAQALDPAFVSCWVGQALVAETMGHQDMFELYRHTTLLGIQTEGCLGFAHLVTQDACDNSLKSNLRTQHRIKTCIPPANDCLTFYTRDKEKDLTGLNMSGLTLEMMGLYQSAVENFNKANQLIKSATDEELPSKLVDCVRCNYGRVLTTVGRLNDALEQYQAIKEPDIVSQCGMALASIKAGRYDEAYNGYTSALHWLAADDTKKSRLLVALAYLQYKFQNIEETKTLLFKSSHLPDAAVEGILALASLGLITGDATLISAALAELEPHAESPDYCHHIAFLRAAHCTVMGDVHEAKLILCQAIHKHPSNAALWRYLSQHLLTFCRNSPLRSSSGAIASSKSAIKLSQAIGKQQKIGTDAICCAMGYLLECNSKGKANITSLRQAQRTVLMCPGSPEAWAMLVTARKSRNPDCKQVKKIANLWAEKSDGDLSLWFKEISNSNT